MSLHWLVSTQQGKEFVQSLQPTLPVVVNSRLKFTMGLFYKWHQHKSKQADTWVTAAEEDVHFQFIIWFQFSPGELGAGAERLTRKPGTNSPGSENRHAMLSKLAAFPAAFQSLLRSNAQALLANWPHSPSSDMAHSLRAEMPFTFYLLHGLHIYNATGKCNSHSHKEQIFRNWILRAQH